jgi:hypothetical protein
MTTLAATFKLDELIELAGTRIVDVDPETGDLLVLQPTTSVPLAETRRYRLVEVPGSVSLSP